MEPSHPDNVLLAWKSGHSQMPTAPSLMGGAILLHSRDPGISLGESS